MTTLHKDQLRLPGMSVFWEKNDKMFVIAVQWELATIE